MGFDSAPGSQGPKPKINSKERKKEFIKASPDSVAAIFARKIKENWNKLGRSGELEFFSPNSYTREVVGEIDGKKVFLYDNPSSMYGYIDGIKLNAEQTRAVLTLFSDCIERAEVSQEEEREIIEKAQKAAWTTKPHGEEDNDEKAVKILGEIGIKIE